MTTEPRYLWSGVDLVTLKLLLAACEEANFAKAAVRENISLSALSKRVSQMEQRFGVELLERHGRGVRPTAAAIQIVPRIQSVFVILNQLAADLNSFSRGELGMIRLRAHMTALGGTLPDDVALFLRSNPNIDIELDEGTSASIVAAVRSGQADIGVVSGTVDTAGLEHHHWAHDRLVAIVPDDHPLASRDSVDFAELIDTPLVALQRDSALLALFREQAAFIGRPLIERTHVTSFPNAIKMVRMGLGFSIIPSNALPGPVPGASILTIRDTWVSRQIVLCVRAQDQLTKPASALFRYLMSLADNGAKSA